MDKSQTFRVFGAKGSGSVAVEAALTLLDLPFSVEELAPWGPPEAVAALAKVNPLGQIPALLPPSGELMTESAAILVWLGDLKPAAGLAPPPDDPDRAAYLRWMSFIPGQIYSLFLFMDYPARWVDGEEAQAELKRRTIERAGACWRTMETQLGPGPWLLGERMSLLDIYAAVVSRWEPGRRWLKAHCPKIAAAVQKVDALPELAALWEERFPFRPGWER